MLFTRRKRMTGGLQFGPPAWHPTQIEEAPVPASGASPLPITHYPLPTPPNTPASLIQLLEQLHLAGTSNITPPLLDQLHALGHRKIQTLILNLLPTQPEFALPAGLTRTSLAELAAGLGLLQKILQPKRTLIVLDRHDLRTRHLWRHHRKSAAKNKSDTQPKLAYEIKGLRNQYPQAHPTVLLKRLFGRRLPVGRLPVRLNHLIVDPVTCWALGRHLQTGRPFTHRPVQLFVQGIKDSSARLVLAQIGESIDALCRRFGITPDGRQVILNGMLAGEEIDPHHTLVQSSTESISLREFPREEVPSACFACGWCVNVCPTSLNPVSLLELAEQAQHALNLGGGNSPAFTSQLHSRQARESLHCIGCGLCSYVCPTRLPLTQQTLRLRNWIQSIQNP